MNKYIAMVVAIFATLFAVNAAAYTPPPAPAKGWYVVDQTGRMTPDQIQKLNQKIDRVSKATKNEFGILLLQDMGGENIEDVANATYKAWGVGKRGLDNGALIVVALKERKSRIETGKGTEGEIPDLRAADILKNNLNPHLKTGDFYGGFDQTIDAVSSFLESRRHQKADPPPAPVATHAPTPVPVATTPVTTTSQPRATSANCDVSGGIVAGGLGWIFILGTLGLIGALLVRSHLRRKREEEEAARQAAEAARRRREERAAKLERERRLDALRALEVERKKNLEVKTPVVSVPFVDRQVSIPPPPTPVAKPPVPRPAPRPVIHSSHVKPTTRKTTTTITPPPPSAAETTAVVAGAGLAAAAALAEAEERARRARQREREEEEYQARQREREAEERRAEERRAREREEEDRRAEERRARAQREEEERQAREREEEAARQSSYSSYSSYSSSDSSSSYDSGSSSYDSGGSSDSGGGFGGGDSGGGGASSDW